MTTRTYADEDVNEVLGELLSIYQRDHVIAIESMFGLTLDEQQRELVRRAQKDDVQIAVKSGTGCGKTLLLVALTFLYLAIYDDCRILISSPSASQLQRVFRTEVEKLYSMLPSELQSMYEMTTEKIEIKRKKHSKLKPREARIVTANASNPESLQGGHASNYIILLDEASGVEDEVFELLQRTLSYGNYKWICTSNPTRNSGYYYDIFTGDQDRTRHWQKLTFSGLDSGIVTDQWLEVMGNAFDKDDDQYKIGVLGEFGRLGENCFFSSVIIEAASKTNYDFPAYMNYPKIVGVDVASQGGDSTVFLTRQGGKIVDIEEHKGLDPMQVVAALVVYHAKMGSSCIFIDATGLGEGVYSRAKELELPVLPVIAASRSPNPLGYANMRSWLYGQVRDWLGSGADIPDKQSLKDEFLNTTSAPSARMAIQLTPKKLMKTDSPNQLDALSYTFAENAYTSPTASHSVRNVKTTRYSGYIV